MIIGDSNERSALARRIFIFAILTAGALVLLGSVSFLLFVLLRDLLETNLALETVRDTKVAAGIILAAGIFLPYYWIVYQQDRRSMLGATVDVERLGRKNVSLLVCEGDTAFIGKVEAALGYKVYVFAWADADESSANLTEVEFCEIARLVSGAPGEYVLLIPEDAGLCLLSYD